jgi:Questin oxidase-like
MVGTVGSSLGLALTSWMRPTAMTITRQDAMNDALERLSFLGFTMENAFSEHGPMVAEAISTLGCNEDVAGWVEAYKQKRRHAPLPPRKQPIDGSNQTEWRNSLGDYSRAADWLAFFREQLKAQRGKDVVANWVPILVPGYFGGLTHGLIRTAHAVRSFPQDANPSELQLDELARGLAYWAATYRLLPGDPDCHGRFGVDEALRHLSRLDPAEQKGPPGAGLNDLRGLTSAVESLAAATDAEEAISGHTAAFARVLIAHPEVPPIPLVHAITAPTAIQNLLPYLSRELGNRFYGYLWQVTAAIAAIFATPAKPDLEADPQIAEPTLQPDELIQRAIEHGDEHTIKLTEACLREDRICPDPTYRGAAEAVLHRTAPLQ